MPVALATGSVHTIVVLDGTSGLKIDSLTDAAASQAAAKGGAATGLGGTAPGAPVPSLAPWLATLAAGLLLAVAGGFGLRRSRRTDAVAGGCLRSRPGRISSLLRDTRVKSDLAFAGCTSRTPTSTLAPAPHHPGPRTERPRTGRVARAGVSGGASR